jgi:hypothetical protein
MFSEQIFEYWATPGGLWTPWAKPVLFLNLDAALLSQPPMDPGAAIDTSWAPPAQEKAVVVLDLPGEVSVLVGIALAHKGYRPVPLYNCCGGRSAVIDVNSITRALVAGGEVLDRLNLPWDAPPVFLLDSRRTAKPANLAPGMFDNRWVTLPQDFPSGNFLASHGVSRAIIIQDQGVQPREDLAHVLLRWQDAGIRIEGAQIGVRPAPLRVNKPSWFRAMFYTAIATIGLRRSSAGGFGSVIPMPSSGGGYG